MRGYRRTRDLAELRAANVTKGTMRPHLAVSFPVSRPAGRSTCWPSWPPPPSDRCPPLLVRDLVDTLTNHGGMGQVDLLAAAMVGVALATTALSLVNRWFGSVIGEGIIYDLRVQLYTHVQRMPVAFFTRTQTGSLMSRLTSDVLDAQNAVGTAASVVSDIFTLVATLIPMFILSPEITSLALLVLPPFIVLDRVMATPDQPAVAPSDATQRRHERQHDGAVQRVGRPAGQAVRPARRRVAGVRPPGRGGPGLRDPAGSAGPLPLRLAVAGRARSEPPRCTGWAAARPSRARLGVGTVVALAAYVTRLYSPLTDLASAQVDVLGAIVELRPGVRGARHAPVGRRPARARRRSTPTARWPAGWQPTASGSATRPPSEVSVASLEATAETVADGLDTEPGDWVLRDVSFVAEPGTMTALVGPSGAGKTTLSSLVPRLYDAVAGSMTIDGHDVKDATLASVSAAVGVVTQDPHLFHDTHRRQPALRPAVGHRRRAGGGLPGGPHPRPDRRRCPTATTPSSANAATGCPAEKNNAWRSPGSCSRIRPW